LEFKWIKPGEDVAWKQRFDDDPILVMSAPGAAQAGEHQFTDANRP
jgi:hypothetical protein